MLIRSEHATTVVKVIDYSFTKIPTFIFFSCDNFQKTIISYKSDG